MEDKVRKVTELPQVTSRLINEIKDVSAEIISLNSRLQAIVKEMEEKEDVLIMDDEDGHQFFAQVDLEQELTIDENQEWNYFEIEGKALETWQEFYENFGDELTDSAKELMTDLKNTSEKIKYNIEVSPPSVRRDSVVDLGQTTAHDRNSRNRQIP